MKLKFNIGMRTLLFKIKHLDSQYTPKGRTEEFYKIFVWNLIIQCKNEVDPLLSNIAIEPVTKSYKQFKIKKL